MPKVSVNILTKDRAGLLEKALLSVQKQTFSNYEAVVVNDGSTDNTAEVIQAFRHLNTQTINHQTSLGITQSRQEALLASEGEYVAILDDDDEWIDTGKLAKQAEHLDEHSDVVLVGGGIKILNSKFKILKHRPTSDAQIRNTMLFRNNFFTSTVMFRREAAITAGGFIRDEIDLAEDYDLWLRIGKLGKMFNFREPFTQYARSSYNKEKFKLFLKKQSYLIDRYKKEYPRHFLASLILRIRVLL